VVVSDLKKETADEVAEAHRRSPGRARHRAACDVTNAVARQALVDAALAAFGKISILVNNAGGGGPKPFDMPMEISSGPTSSMSSRCSA
jgi:7-alpha-hydroxysteroid dehydrogenase